MSATWSMKLPRVKYNLTVSSLESTLQQPGEISVTVMEGDYDGMP